MKKYKVFLFCVAFLMFCRGIGAAPLFYENFNSSSTLDTSKWVTPGNTVYGDPNCPIAVVQVAPGDNALLLKSYINGASTDYKTVAANWGETFLASANSFTRGNNLRVTFSMWGANNAPCVNSFMGWALTNTNAQAYANPAGMLLVGGGATYLPAFGLFELPNGDPHGFSWENNINASIYDYGDGPMTNLIAAATTALSKSTALKMRVTLADTATGGCKISFSTDGGQTFIAADNGDSTKYAPRPAGQAANYLSFSPGLDGSSSGTFVDDIVVENDNNLYGAYPVPTATPTPIATPASGNGPLLVENFNSSVSLDLSKWTTVGNPSFGEQAHCVCGAGPGG